MIDDCERVIIYVDDRLNSVKFKSAFEYAIAWFAYFVGSILL